MRRRTDPRTDQQRRGIERTAREDDLLPGLDPHHIPAALEIFDAGRARALHQHASRVRAGRDIEAFPLLRGSEIGGRGRGAIAVPDGVLTAPEAFLLLAVVVV